MRRNVSAGKKGKSSELPGSAYLVRGFVINLDDRTSPRARNAALRAIREAVPMFRRVVDERALGRTRPLGKGTADVLVPLPRHSNVGIKQAWDIVHALHQSGLVADAEPAVRTVSGVAPPEGARRSAVGGPDGPPLPQASDPEWSVKSADVVKAWAKSRGEGVLVGHPDTGYTAHPQLDRARLRTADGYNFEDDKPDPMDPMTGKSPGHGTATASVIMAAIDPIFGVAPEASMVPFRVSDSVVHFDFTNLTRALYLAQERKCDLVSMSLGGPWAGRALGRAVDALVADGIILLAAAGNVWPWVVYPAKFDNVVAVAASNAIDKPWRDSASGEEVDITAPGESVWRAFTQIKGKGLDFSLAPSSGTSYAVATAAGACALWLARHGGAGALRTRYGGRLAAVFLEVLKTGGFRAVNKWDASKYGPGILDATALLDAPLPEQAPVTAIARRNAVTRAERSYAWARLQPYFPELSPDELARAIVPAFGRRSAVAVGNLADVIDEVEFYVATDPAIRQSVIRAARPTASGKRAAARGKRSGTTVATSPKLALRASGSARLKAAIKG